MKRPISILFALLFLLVFAVSQATASSVLYDWAFNIDGTLSEFMEGDSMPGNTSGFDQTTGLGTLTFTISDTGNHNFIAFFDHESDQATNTYFNEIGSAVGLLATGQSWEIDEPGWDNDGTYGDIYDNVLGGSLDNQNFNDQFLTDDVSMAMGWDFNLLAEETATITLLLSYVAPGSGFYLSQTDAGSGAIIYFSSSKTITGGGQVPEPATILLLGAGLLGLLGFGRKIGVK